MRLNEVYYSVYGEQPFMGIPMLFVRFAGCNVGCEFCDQDWSVQMEMSEQDLLDEINECPSEWVCFTGGEPLLQLKPKFVGQVAETKNVCIETNGTMPWKHIPGVYVACSPKVWPINPGLDVDYLKLLVGDGKEFWQKPLPAARKYFLQPVWNDNYKHNLVRAIAIVEEFPDTFVLSIQVHKYIGIK